MFDDGTVAARRAPVRRAPADRALIVAETYEPGATVAGVARRHGIVASQLSSWRTAAKRRAPLCSATNKMPPPRFAEFGVSDGRDRLGYRLIFPRRRIVDAGPPCH